GGALDHKRRRHLLCRYINIERLTFSRRNCANPTPQHQIP
ncbi:unnamed protein product, partial [Brassica rapa]